MYNPRRSNAEQIQKVRCPPPTRFRHDDQIVELFLYIWKEGRFSRNLNWLAQSQSNVEVIAMDANPVRVAIEHTRLFAFEDHKLQEVRLRPIAICLEAEPQLRVAGRRFDLCFQGKFLGELPQRFRSLVKEELRNWAVQTLPGLATSNGQYEFNVPIHLPGDKVLTISVEIEVSERDESMRAVSVGGYLPPDSKRLVPVVRKALKDKLPKLVAANVDLRILLLELPIMIHPPKVIDTVRELAAQFPELEKVDYIVVADTFAWMAESYILFWIWDRRADNWSDILRPIVAARVDNGR